MYGWRCLSERLGRLVSERHLYLELDVRPASGSENGNGLPVLWVFGNNTRRFSFHT
jgi:hypothetical protein